jgi:hypothetical protein
MAGAVQSAAGSQLTRDKDAIFGIKALRDSPPGVYTAWFGIFNNPDQCATRPCSAFPELGATNQARV